MFFTECVKCKKTFLFNGESFFCPDCRKEIKREIEELQKELEKLKTVV